MSVKPASPEQLAVVRAFKENNVKVPAVAGAGKTTTCMHIALAYPEESILVLTFNRRLMEETKKRIDDAHIKNMEMRTYHSFAMANYGSGHTDTDIIALVQQATPPRRAYAYRKIIFDETQDQRPCLHWFAKKVIADNSYRHAFICKLGDSRQMIYKYKQSDARFLTLAEHLQSNSSSWVECRLSTSYRVNSAHANFVNEVMLHERVILPARQSPIMPDYLICDPKKAVDEVFGYIYEYLTYVTGASPEDIMVIAPSIKPSKKKHAAACTPIDALMNRINQHNIEARKARRTEWPIARNDDEDYKLSDNVVHGKILFSTIHGVKGCERKFVIVFGFDMSFAMFADEGEEDMTRCPNLLYVAATRATHHMLLIHDKNFDYLPFLDGEKLAQYACVRGECKPTGKKSSRSMNYTVTKLTSHIAAETLVECMKLVTKVPVRPAAAMIQIAVECEQKLGAEQVADITGDAIPLYYQYTTKLATTATSTMPSTAQKKTRSKAQAKCSLSMVEYLWSMNRMKIMANYKEFIGSIKKDPSKLSDISNLLRVCTIFKAVEHNMPYKAHQITDYGWISSASRDAATARMASLGLSPDADYEFEFKSTIRLPIGNYVVAGFADCVDLKTGTIYEFKCTGELKDEHIIQTALYTLLWAMREQAAGREAIVLKAMLYNILSDELIEVRASIDDLKKIMELLVTAGSAPTHSDAEFIELYKGAPTMASIVDASEDEDDMPEFMPAPDMPSVEELIALGLHV
jgi:hypothetical protein